MRVGHAPQHAADRHLKCCLLCRGCVAVAADSRRWEARGPADAVGRAADLWERGAADAAGRSGCISCKHVLSARTPPPAPVWHLWSDHRASKPQGSARSAFLSPDFTCAAAACRGRCDGGAGARVRLRHGRRDRCGLRLQLRRGRRRGPLEGRNGWASLKCRNCITSTPESVSNQRLRLLLSTGAACADVTHRQAASSGSNPFEQSWQDDDDGIDTAAGAAEPAEDSSTAIQLAGGGAAGGASGPTAGATGLALSPGGLFAAVVRTALGVPAARCAGPKPSELPEPLKPCLGSLT